MPDRINLTWIDVRERAEEIAVILDEIFGNISIPLCLYGVPRGGIQAAHLVSERLSVKGVNNILVEDIEEVDVIIDDIIDTGATRKKYDEYTNQFYALVDYQGKDKPDKGRWTSFPWERMSNEDAPTQNIVRLLQYIGEDPEREGLKETPDRVIISFEKLYGGYKQSTKDIIKCFEKETCDEIVLLKNIEFYSTCEHHMLPFFGKAHIAYIPNKRVIGISKLARILEIYARRLQIQERLCQQITKDLQEFLDPQGAACIIEAQHFCMTSRGVEKQNSIMVTSSLTGVFKTKIEARQELMSMVLNERS